jgi:SAM-dependent methyltransferase
VSPHRIRFFQRWQRLVHPAWLVLLHKTQPLSERWGHERGQPIDRYYIESFLQSHRADICGRVIEIRESLYTDQFGSAVTRREILDFDAANPRATFVADLAHADHVPGDSMDCFILTQTLQFIFDPSAALAQIYRILRPNGVLLATVPGISRVDPALREIDYWRYTRPSVTKLLTARFGANNFTVQVFGNVLTAMGFLTGIAREEIAPHDLERVDEAYPVILAVRAVKRLLGQVT